MTPDKGEEKISHEMLGSLDLVNNGVCRCWCCRLKRGEGLWLELLELDVVT